MIEIERFTLKNGLRVIVHPDNSTPMAAINILYNVGSRDETPDQTGFAHLFEHLMFGGSKNIPSYDQPLQLVGGDNNAWTSSDVTNYYLTLPAVNLETGFWLESDRMLELDFNQHSLDVQKKVVVEEFKQRYINQPYGDIPHLIRPLAYKNHSYQWPTIGKELSHIEQAKLEDVKEFFFSHYAPNNAILVVAGNIDIEHVKQLCVKWFEPIPSRRVPSKDIPIENEQTHFRSLTVERDVPASLIHLTFHIGSRIDDDYYTEDLLSDVLSNGASSRLYQSLVKNQKLFSEINAYISGDIDPGLFTVTGNLLPNTTMEQAEKAIWNELELIKEIRIDQYELQKVKNKIEANLEFSEINFLSKAMNLAMFELLGDANLINSESAKYQNVSIEDIHKIAKKTFRKENCSTLYYHSTQLR